VASRQPNDQFAMKNGQCARRHNQPAIRGTRECRDSALDFGGLAHVDLDQIHSERWRDALECTHLSNPGSYCCIPKNCYSRQVWRNPFKLFQPLHADPEFEQRKSSDVAAWPRQAGDEPGADGIRDLREHNRYGGHLSQRCHDCAATR
jgi:hypothetical protein